MLAILGGIVLAGAYLLWLRSPAFEGRLLVPRGGVEHLVIAIHDPEVYVPIEGRAVVPENLPFDNGETGTRLDATQRYDAVRLPFGIRFNSVAVLEARPDDYAVVFHTRDGESTLRVAVGDFLEIGEVTYTIVGIGPWEGLIRHSGGEPMAVINLERGDLTGPIFLDAGTWVYPDRDTAILLQWHENETMAGEKATTWAMAEEAARWGVQDGTSIQWMQSFVPGGMVKTWDGSGVRLVRRGADRRHIEVQRMQDGPIETHAVEANRPVSENGLIYENPALAQRLIVVHAWGDGVGLIQWRGSDGGIETEKVLEGERWSEDGGVPVRLDQVVAEALPLTVADGHIEAINLRWGDRHYVLREALIKTIDNTRIEFRRRPRQPQADYSLDRINDQGEVLESALIGTNGTWRSGAWTFRIDGEALFSEDHVVLSAHRSGWLW